MRQFPRQSVSVLCLVFFGVLAIGCAGRERSAFPKNFRVGVAETDITPPVGYRMAGYFEERRSTGIHDPLMARAMVFQQGPEKIALVFCDLVGVSLNLSRIARQRASEMTGIPMKSILIAATHSHTGPLFDDPRAKYFHQLALEKFGSDSQEQIDYPGFLEEKLIEVICQAQSRLKPAQLAVGVAKQEGLAFNCRFHMMNGTVAFNPGQLNPNIVRPARPTDPDVGMLLVRDAKQKLRAGLTVFAMHADTVG